MSCQRTLTIAEAEVARYFHFAFDALSVGDILDCTSTIHLPLGTGDFPPGGTMDYAFVPGRQVNALSFFNVPPGGHRSTSVYNSLAALNHDGTGFSLCAWIFITSYGNNVNAVGTIKYEGVPLAFKGQIRWYFSNSGAFFVANDGTGGHVETIPVAIPSLGAWHFLHMFQDMTALKMGIQWDNGAPTYASFTPTPSGASTGGVVQVAESSGGWVTNEWMVDEVTVRLDRSMTAAQLAYLYNAGAGRTCPIVLP